ncbi:hypothetical protein JXA27_06945 [Aerococcaceae bacterium zg-B36]|uniref:phage holin, LLH family n=1 Tax=Aerococcaceae bacterium zg-252 TaxID=2796928 RepID=UPI001BD8FDF0|nr:hypothetical protein [Aerococcaceae bacterium zg-B36]
MEHINEALLNSVVLILTAVIGVIGKYVRDIIVIKIEDIKKNTTATEQTIIQNVGMTTVQAVEQLFKDIHGEAKFKKALDIFLKEMNAIGINVTGSQARTVIEAAVLELQESTVVLEDFLTGTTKNHEVAIEQ